MSEQIIKNYYKNLYKKHPGLVYTKNEEIVRNFIEKYFGIKK